MSFKEFIKKWTLFFWPTDFEKENQKRLLKKTISLTKPSDQVMKPVVKGLQTSGFELILRKLPSKAITLGLRLKQFKKLRPLGGDCKSIEMAIDFDPESIVKSNEILPFIEYKDMQEFKLINPENSDEPSFNVKSMSFDFSALLVNKHNFEIPVQPRNFDIESSFRVSIDNGLIYIKSPRIYSNLSIVRSYPFVLKSKKLTSFSRKERIRFFENIKENQRLTKDEYKILAIYTEVPLDSARNIKFSDDFKVLTIDLSYRVSANIRSSVLIIGREIRSKEIFRQIIISY